MIARLTAALRRCWQGYLALVRQPLTPEDKRTLGMSDIPEDRHGGGWDTYGDDE